MMSIQEKFFQLLHPGHSKIVTSLFLYKPSQGSFRTEVYSIQVHSSLSHAKIPSTAAKRERELVERLNSISYFEVEPDSIVNLMHKDEP